jgi:transposase
MSPHAEQVEYAADPRQMQAHSKKKTHRAAERDTPEIAVQRHAYPEKMRTIDANASVFLDETGVNLAMARPSARAPQGARAYASTPVNKGKNIPVLGALSLDGIIAAMTVEGSPDTQVFLTDVQTILVPTLRPGQSVMMDNLSSHKDDRIQTAIESVGATLEYLPPYSPDFSPIEQGWSKVKAMLRATAARTRATRDAAITQALNMVTPQDARGWFDHCGYL